LHTGPSYTGLQQEIKANFLSHFKRFYISPRFKTFERLLGFFLNVFISIMSSIPYPD